MKAPLRFPEGAARQIGREHLNVHGHARIGLQEPAQDFGPEPFPAPGRGDAKLSKPKRWPRLGPLGMARVGRPGAEEHGPFTVLESMKESLTLRGDVSRVVGGAPFVLKKREAAVHQRCKGALEGASQPDRRDGQAGDVLP